MPELETDMEQYDIRSPKSSISESIAETPKKTVRNLKNDASIQRKKTPVVNRNLTLAGMRKDRKEYQDKRLNIEREKIELQKRKIEVMQERNQLLKERNNLLKSDTY